MNKIFLQEVRGCCRARINFSSFCPIALQCQPLDCLRDALQICACIECTISKTESQTTISSKFKSGVTVKIVGNQEQHIWFPSNFHPCPPMMKSFHKSSLQMRDLQLWECKLDWPKEALTQEKFHQWWHKTWRGHARALQTFGKKPNLSGRVPLKSMKTRSPVEERSLWSKKEVGRGWDSCKNARSAKKEEKDLPGPIKAD